MTAQVVTVVAAAEVTAGALAPVATTVEVVAVRTSLAPHLRPLVKSGIRNSNGEISISTLACYCRGTLITTSLGAVPVEELRIGDSVVTVFGRLRSIKWIGTCSYFGGFLASNPKVLPVRLKAGCLDGSILHRDLLLSAEHAMLFDGSLTPARHLLNGRTILRERDLGQGRVFPCRVRESRRHLSRRSRQKPTSTEEIGAPPTMPPNTIGYMQRNRNLLAGC